MKKKFIHRVILLAALIFNAFPAFASPTGIQTGEAQEIFDRINQSRADQGQFAWVYSSFLAELAQSHSEYQASIGEGTHEGANGSTPYGRAYAAGYGEIGEILVEEMRYNSVAGTPAKAISFWQKSDIHEPILHSSKYHEVGIGFAESGGEVYYTVVVGTHFGVTSPGVGSEPTPLPANTSTAIEIASAGVDGSVYHMVQPGQTYAAIAAAYNIPLDNLLALNGLIDTGEPQVGTTLTIQLPVVVVTATTEPEAQATATAAEDLASPTSQIELPTAALAQVTSEPDGQTAQPPSRGINWGIVALVGVLVVIAIVLGIVLYSQFTSEMTSKEIRKKGGFYTLSLHEQVAALEAVARQALQSYPLMIESVELMRYVLNAEFLISGFLEGEAEPKEYVLRINAPYFNTSAEIRSELEWLDALNRDTRLDVPRPIRSSSDAWFVTVPAGAVPEARTCTLFQFLPGDTIEDRISPQLMEIIGEFVAYIHNHGSSWTPSPRFTRKHWDQKGLSGGVLGGLAKHARTSLLPNEWSVIQQAKKIVDQACAKLGKSPQVYGLIHGDLHEKSYLFNQNRPLVLDFDTCGYGYFVYDLAVTIWNLYDHPNFTELKDALLRGYRKARSLSPVEESVITPMIMGRLMVHTLTIAAYRESPAIREIASKAIARQVDLLEKVIQGIK